MNLKSLFFLFFCTVVLSQASGQELSATAIVEKVSRNREGQIFYSEIKMTIIRPTWEREIGAKMWVKTQDFSFVLLTSPVRERGQVFLKRKNHFVELATEYRAHDQDVGIGHWTILVGQ